MNKDLRHAMLLLSRGITLDKLDYWAERLPVLAGAREANGRV